jgi:hypothetical protein
VILLYLIFGLLLQSGGGARAVQINLSKLGSFFTWEAGGDLLTCPLLLTPEEGVAGVAVANRYQPQGHLHYIFYSGMGQWDNGDKALHYNPAAPYSAT